MRMSGTKQNISMTYSNTFQSRGNDGTKIVEKKWSQRKIWQRDRINKESINSIFTEEKKNSRVWYEGSKQMCLCDEYIDKF